MDQQWRDSFDDGLDVDLDSNELEQPRVRVSPGKATRTLATGGGGGTSPTSSRYASTGRIDRKASGGAPGADAGSLVNAAASSSGTALDDGLRGRLEAFSGRDLGGVQVHTGSASAEAAKSVNAHAYTQAQSIHFAPGTYSPTTKDGQELIAHEVAHTIQQGSQDLGVQTKLAVSGPGDSHEREADAFASAFVSGASSFQISGSASSGTLHRRGNEQDTWTSPAEVAALARQGGEVAGPGGERIVMEGPPTIMTGAELNYRVAIPPYIASSDFRVRFEWFCVNDLTHRPRAIAVFDGPNRPRWEGARYGFPGEHVIVCKVTFGERVFGLGIVQSVATPRQRLDEGFEQAEEVDLESFETGLILQEAMISKGAMSIEGAAIQCSGPNPAIPGRAPDYARPTYRLTEPHPEAARSRWYARCASWDGMPARNFYGHRRITIDGEDALDLGGGPLTEGAGAAGAQARFIIASRNTYTIYCDELDSGGNLVRSSSYIQGVVSEEEAAQVQAFREYQDTVAEVSAGVEDAQPVKAVYVNKESGSTVQLNLYYGRAKEGGMPTLIDLTPGVPRREYDAGNASDLVGEFTDKNSYPEGLIKMAGPLGTHTIETDGGSTWTEWANVTGWISLGLAVVGAAATLTGVGAAVGVPLMIAAGATGAASAGFSLAEHLTHADLDEVGIAIDLVGIVTSLLSGGLAARGASVMTKGVRFALYADLAGTGIEGTLIASQFASSFDQILGDENMSSADKRAALLRLGAVAVVQGAMIAVALRSSSVDLQHGRVRGGSDNLEAPSHVGRGVDVDQSARGLFSRGTGPKADAKAREIFLGTLTGDAKARVELLSAADLRAIYSSGSYPVNLGYLARIEGFTEFAKQYPAELRRLCDGSSVVGINREIRQAVETASTPLLGWRQAAANLETVLPQSRPHGSHESYTVVTRGEHSPDWIPDANLRPTRELDHNGAFMQSAAGRNWRGKFKWDRSAAPDYTVMNANQLIVNGKPLESMSGVLVFSGHGGATGFAGVKTSVAAKMAADQIEEMGGGIQYVVLDACNQRNARWMFGGSNAQAFQDELRKLLGERGITGEVTVLAASRGGPTYGSSQRTYLPFGFEEGRFRRGHEFAEAQYTPADDGSRLYVSPLGAIVGGSLALEAGVGIYLAVDHLVGDDEEE